ncbi:unknown protein [Microcystis aeruginosa NIES-843]|uniref:Uncharacterized protein n=1 Tax=Microcystis aeruginosa (strain NIES-843 / IAM M-2473) TaxID=449447 RepID=B0JSI3_MICAN|nr:unknown protein [Microcystis aeruginosa NIES-843]
MVFPIVKGSMELLVTVGLLTECHHYIRLGNESQLKNFQFNQYFQLRQQFC